MVYNTFQLLILVIATSICALMLVLINNGFSELKKFSLFLILFLFFTTSINAVPVKNPLKVEEFPLKVSEVVDTSTIIVVDKGKSKRVSITPMELDKAYNINKEIKSGTEYYYVGASTYIHPLTKHLPRPRAEYITKTPLK